MNHTPPTPASAARHLQGIQRTIARAVRSPDDLRQLGDVLLLPHQQRAAAQLRRMLAWHHGALLADEVGLGKTYSALAVATRYDTVHVIAPAGLLAMWHAALLRTGQRHVRVHSLHGCSRRAPALERHGSTLVIIDEAHHLRHRNTARYRRIAHAVTGCHVLLLSATPVHNRPTDLRTLFALFRGDRGDTLRDDVLAALIVRRTAGDVESGNSGAATPTSERPRVAEHRPWHVPQDRVTLDLLLALPAPLPAHDGAVAGALIRLGLLRAWCSSDAALDAALSRRVQRGEAMRDALVAGRHPTTGELAAWITGDDATQLAFPELLVEHTVQSEPMLEALDRHLHALRALRRHHRHTARGDTHRAEQLRQLRHRHPDTPVVAFSQHARTVQALYRALSDIAGVGMLTADGGQIASGPIPRRALLEAFAPRAHERPPPKPGQSLWLLLATDLIAEGVNLHDAGVVVHLDLPWTAALREQRVGRAVRLGSQHPVVHVYRFAPDTPARHALHLEVRLARKLAHARRFVGGSSQPVVEQAVDPMTNPVAGRGATPLRPSPPPIAERSAAEAQAEWQRRLDVWAMHTGASAREPRGTGVPVAAVQAESGPSLHGGSGALVLVRVHGVTQLLALQGLETTPGTRRRLTTSVRALARLADCIDRATPVTPQAVAPLWQQARPTITRAVATWLRRRRVRATLGLPTGRQDTHARPPRGSAPASQRALAAITTMLTRCTPAERTALREVAQAARAMAVRMRGVAAEEALLQWARAAPLAGSGEPAATVARRAWLEAWHTNPLLGQRSPRAGVLPDRAHRRARPRLVAVLLIVPAPSGVSVTLEA